jgi:hypothetical protein
MMSTRRPLAALAPVLALAIAAAAPAQPAPWSLRWNGPADRHDEPIKLLAGADGSSLVLARSDLASPLPGQQRLALLRYAPDGTAAWTMVDPLLESSEFVEPAIALAGASDAVLAAYTGATLVVRRVRLSDGGTIWQRERPLAPHLPDRRPPRIAVDVGTGAVLVAVADGTALRVLRWRADGEALLPDLQLAVPDQVLQPSAIVAGPDGEVVVAVWERSLDAGSGNLVVGFAADGALRFQNREPGPLGNQFDPPRMVGAGDGTVTLLGHSESTCGVPQQLLWRLDRDGVRQWLRSWPDAPCSGSTPAALGVLPDGAVMVVHTRIGSAIRMGANRYRADGSLDWSRSWQGGPPAFGAAAFDGAADAGGGVIAVGAESLPGSIGRLAFAHWTADGGLCGHGQDAQGSRATTAASDGGGGWLLAGYGRGLAPGSAATDVLLHRLPAAPVCAADPLFRNGFEGDGGN